MIAHGPPCSWIRALGSTVEKTKPTRNTTQVVKTMSYHACSLISHTSSLSHLFQFFMTGWAPWCFSVFDLYGRKGLGNHALNPNISIQVLHIYYSLYISYGAYRDNLFNNQGLLESGIIAYMYIFMALIFGCGVILLEEIRGLSLIGVKGLRHPTKIHLWINH